MLVASYVGRGRTVGAEVGGDLTTIQDAISTLIENKKAELV